uniref:Uncharacterized protein n=1 Tax=Rhizophora mucronata TaxID=61149 RepID=A0A2P2ITM4_RHIMU
MCSGINAFVELCNFFVGSDMV